MGLLGGQTSGRCLLALHEATSLRLGATAEVNSLGLDPDPAPTAIYSKSPTVGPSHHYPPTVSKTTAPQIVAQSPSDSSNTKNSAFPLLSEEAALDADREGGDGSTPTLQKSEGQPRSVAVFPHHLLLANRPEKRAPPCTGNAMVGCALAHAVRFASPADSAWGERGGKPPLNPEQSRL